MAKSNLQTKDIFKILENWAPKTLAYDWDPVGLQVGSYNQAVSKVMVTLDVDLSVVEEAIEKDVDVIIAHHPLLFKPMKQINMDTPIGKVVQKLISNEITVYAAHTNLDIATGGVNDMLMDMLDIEHTDILIPTETEVLCKVVVYVPGSAVEAIRKAFHETGAGHIGDYSHCTFQSQGEGTFKPLEGADPYIGNINELEVVPEYKMETIVPKANLSNVIKGMIAAHPYEEPAFDIYQLENEGKQTGLGRIGELSESMPLGSFAEKVKEAFHVETLRMTGNKDKLVKKVAVLGGSGEKYIGAAKAKGADVYITGDMTFHPAQDAYHMGLNVIDAGHYIEHVMKKYTADYLDRQMDDIIEVIISETNTDPFQYI